MKPRPIVQIQSALALATTLVAIAVCERPAALGAMIASGVGLGIAGFLAIRYERLTPVSERSKHRALRDQTMRTCIVAGLAVPLALSIYVVAAGALTDPVLGGAPAHVAAVAACAVFASMLTSSCVDWYLIRAFRDGVLGEPACQMDRHDEETALYYARAWISHRTVAELLGWGGASAVLVVALVALQQSSSDPAWSAFFTYVAPAGAVYLGIGGYLARRLRPVPGYVQRPSPGLGRWARGTIVDCAGREQRVEGFVVDVALGVGMRILREPEGKLTEVPLEQAAKLSSVRRALCTERCEEWLGAQCERGLREAESKAGATSQDAGQ